jgi:hypothetical protein
MPSKLTAYILNYTDQVLDFHTSEHSSEHILYALDIMTQPDRNFRKKIKSVHIFEIRS